MNFGPRLNHVRTMPWVGFAVGLGMVLGCGTADYEARLDETIHRLKIANKFVDLDAKETLIAAIRNDQGTGAKISFRKPMFFSGVAFAEGLADPRNPEQPLKPERVKPPALMAFPGFQFSYEVIQVSPKGGRGVSYLYAGAQPTQADAAEQIVTQLQQAYPEAPAPTWSNVAIDTPEGTSVPWKMLSLSGNQEFWLPGGTIADNFPGTFTLWMREQQGYQVFLALRASTMGNDSAALQRYVTAALGTVRIATGVKIE